MSDSDERYEVPSGGTDEDNQKVEVSVLEIAKEATLDTESKEKGEKPEPDDKLMQQMKLLAVIDQKQEEKDQTKQKEKGSTSIIGNPIKTPFYVH